MLRIKKALALVGLVALGATLTACGVSTSGEDSNHVHELIKLSSREATCRKEGRLAYWHCEGCNKYYLDADATQEVSLSETVLEKLPHKAEKTEEVAPTCTASGVAEFWTCLECEQIFSDEACTVPAERGDLSLPKVSHTLTHVQETPIQGNQNGVKEHWTCDVCEGYFADDSGKKSITQMDTILYSVFNIPDFIVNVPVGRDPVVLQLTDTQIIDGAQVREGREGVSKTFYATKNIQKYCYDYVTEVIEKTNPDLILLTGDNVYGEFDDNGSVWTSFVNFMDSFEIPWAPIMGNHDNESRKGVDWQCEQLENAQYCLFEQKELTGNGNYSVGIAQGDELKRVFYMLDSNGCGNASAETLANGHTTSKVGFGQDQIEWYTKQIEILKEYSPETKISFAYHIQPAIFADAYAKYGFKEGQTSQDINIDLLPNKADGDFGLIGRDLKTEWDKNKKIYEGMKRLGVDSIFVGHEHCNSASVVYEGIRFQFGQKSSIYDRYNHVDANGNVIGADGEIKAGETALIGGSVIVLSQTDGSIKDAYIQYCEEAGGKIDWSQFVE